MSYVPSVKCFKKDAEFIDTCMIYAYENEEPFFELSCHNGTKFKIYFVHITDDNHKDQVSIQTAVRDGENNVGEIRIKNYKYVKGIPIFGCNDLRLATVINPKTLTNIYYIINLTLLRMDNSDNPLWQYIFTISFTDKDKKDKTK